MNQSFYFNPDYSSPFAESLFASDFNRSLFLDTAKLTEAPLTLGRMDFGAEASLVPSTLLTDLSFFGQSDDRNDFLDFKTSDSLSNLGNGHIPDFEVYDRDGNRDSTLVEHPIGEFPSRTLFVRNISSVVEDSEIRELFETYGPIRSIYSTCKHRGFVMVSFFDLRHACAAMKELQGYLLRRRPIDLHFSIPKNNPSEKDQNQGTLVVFNLDPLMSNEDICQLFGNFGEIREIRESPHKKNHKFIEFYDVRDADRAMKSLNRTEIYGKRIKIEASRPGGHRKVVPQRMMAPTPPSPPISPSHHPQPPPQQQQQQQQPSPSHIPEYPFRPMIPPSSPMSSMTSHFASSPFHSGNSNANATQTQSAPSATTPTTFSATATPFHIPLHHQPLPRPASSSSTSSSPPRDPIPPFVLPSSTHLAPFAHHSYGMFENGSASDLLGISQNGSGNGDFISSPFRSDPNGDMAQNSHSSSIVDTLPFRTFSSDQSPFLTNSIDFTPERFSNNMSPHSMQMGAPRQSPTMSPSRIAITQQQQQQQQQSVVMAQQTQQSMQSQQPQSPIQQQQQQQQAAESEGSTVGINSNSGMNIFALDISRVQNGDDTRTTLMIRNIPNKYTQKMLLDTINEQFNGTYDFFYLPIDFKNKCNMGYAFINFVSPLHIVPFSQRFRSRKWDRFNSEKVCELAYARIQGTPALVQHFSNSSLLCEDKKCRPLLLVTEGTRKGEVLPFPSQEFEFLTPQWEE